MKRAIAVDPGSSKCGLLLADLSNGIVLDGKVVSKDNVKEVIIRWRDEENSELIFLGNGTSCQYWHAVLSKILPLQLVEERGTTLKARRRYWELWPPNIFLRLLPRGMVLPPKDLDAIAALVLLEDYLNVKLIWPAKPDFKI